MHCLSVAVAALQTLSYAAKSVTSQSAQYSRTAETVRFQTDRVKSTADRQKPQQCSGVGRSVSATVQPIMQNCSHLATSSFEYLGRRRPRTAEASSA